MAIQKQGISQKVAIGDPRDPTAVLKVNSDGSINTNGGGGGGGVAQGAVTTTPPSYTTGTNQPLSLDTSGNLRVAVSGGGSNGFVSQGSTTSGQVGPLIQAAVTTAAPTYTTAQTSPLSLDLKGGVRTLIQDATGAPIDWSAPALVTGVTANGGAANPAPVVFGGRTSGGAVVTSAITTGGAIVVASDATFPVQASQAGTWTVQPGNTANTTPWLFTGSGSAATPATGSLSVQGFVAAAATAGTTNPVAIGGNYTGTLPTYSTGQRVTQEYTLRGAAFVSLMEPAGGSPISASSNPADAVSNTATVINALSRNYAFNGTTYDRIRTIAGSFGATTGVLAVEQAGAPFANISTNTTTTVKSGAGILHKIVINQSGATGNTFVIYNNTAGSGATIASGSGVVTTPTTLFYDLAFDTGLTVVTATGTAANITVVYR